MRADMAKVIVERPRLGRTGSHKVKGEQRRLARYGDDGPPSREGLKFRYGHNRKHFNEHLGPLRRYLDKQVGRPWDKVYAEICTHLRRDSVVQKHVHTHVADYVLRDVILVDGVPCHGEGRMYGLPIASYGPRWYVCPRTGLLRRLERKSRKRKPVTPGPTPPIIPLGGEQQCRCIAGRWHLVTLRRLPVAGPPRLRSPAFDVLLGQRVAKLPDEVARKEYGALVYAVDSRPLARHELSQYPIPDCWWR